MEKLAFLDIPTISQPSIQSEQQWLAAFHQADNTTSIRYQMFTSVDAALSYQREVVDEVEETWLIKPPEVSAIADYNDIDGIKYAVSPSTSTPLVLQKRLSHVIRNFMIDNHSCASNYDFMLYIFYNIASQEQRESINAVFLCVSKRTPYAT